MSTAGLSTHVLDLVGGRPAAGMTIEIWYSGRRVKTVITNADGRTDGPLVAGSDLVAGAYELVFHVGPYFDNTSFLDRVPIRFVVTDATARYHVPLLCTPWGYSTYRGS
jgi:5-hydroxyisourate hydrolase